MACELQSLMSQGRWPDDIDLWHLAIPDEGSEPSRLLDGHASIASEENATRTRIADVRDRLDNAQYDDGALAVLNPSERQRALHYRQSADRRRFVHTRAALRTLLGERLRLPAVAVPLQAGARGRLFVAGQEALSFNVTHAGEHALIALSNVRDVGVDVERLDATLDWEALAGLVCTSGEVDALHRRRLPDRHHGFFRCWTAKEALLKTLGLGITEGLKALSVDIDGVATQRPAVDINALPALAPAKDLRFVWLDEFPEYVGCLAFHIGCA